jgi:CheY-like chemotaxis protein
VLVVDDNQAIRTVMRNILAEWHDVESATSVAEAMRRIKTGVAIDVIICDVTMPGLSGLDLQSYLEVRHPELAERTCFVSGLVGTAREAELLARVPRHRLLGKPFTPEELLAAIATIARR